MLYPGTPPCCFLGVTKALKPLTCPFVRSVPLFNTDSISFLISLYAFLFVSDIRPAAASIVAKSYS